MGALDSLKSQGRTQSTDGNSIPAGAARLCHKNIISLPAATTVPPGQRGFHLCNESFLLRLQEVKTWRSSGSAIILMVDRNENMQKGPMQEILTRDLISMVNTTAQNLQNTNPQVLQQWTQATEKNVGSKVFP